MPTDIRIDATLSVGCLVMTVVGEVDLDNFHQLRDAFTDADPTLPLVLDLSQVPFIDSIGLSTLVQENQAMAARGLGFALVPSEMLAQLIAVSGLERILATQPSVAAALTAIGGPIAAAGGD